MALPDVAYRLIGWFSTTRFDRIVHPALYRLTGGRGIVGHALGAEMVVVTATGRRSGRPKAVALFGFRVGPAEGAAAGSWAVIGSRGGSNFVPGWVHNLRATPDATLQVRGQRSRVRAREIPAGPDYEAIFELAARAYPGYRLYRRESPIHIPIVVLEPGPEAGAA